MRRSTRRASTACFFLVDAHDVDHVALVDAALQDALQGREVRHVRLYHGAVLEPVDELAAPLALELLDPALVFDEELEEALVLGL